MRSAWTTVERRWATQMVVRPCHEFVQRRLDEPLGLGVERAGGLVEDQDRGVAEDGAGDGESLALAAGEVRAAFADDGVVAVRLARG